MAYASIQYEGTGSQTNFAVPFAYLSKTHVRAFVDGTQVAIAWTTPQMASVVPAPAAGSIVTISRTTPRDQVLVDFVGGSTLVESDLDTATLQSFFLAQEAFDASGSTIAVAPDGSYDAGARRISNGVAPTGPNDFATRGWVETSMTSPVAQAVAAKDAAVVAQGLAEAARTGATNAAATAVSEAGKAATQAGLALGYSTAADGHAVRAETARDAIVAAESAVITARDATLTAAGVATAARDVTTSARDAAVVAKDAAVVARNQAEQFAQDAANAAAANAAGIPFSPTSDIQASNVQAAIQEAYAESARTTHEHSIANVTGLQTALDSKSATGHGHAISEVSGLEAALGDKLGTTGATLGNYSYTLTSADRTNGWNVHWGNERAELKPALLTLRGTNGTVEFFNAAGVRQGALRDVGDGRIAIERDTGGVYLAVKSDGTASMTYANFSARLDFQADRNLVYYVDNVATWTPGTGMISDARHKRDVKPLNGPDSLAAVQLLQGVSYHWVKDLMGPQEDLGFLAQDVEKLIPQAVRNVGDTKHLNYVMLIPVLVEAVKVLAARVEELEKHP